MQLMNRKHASHIAASQPRNYGALIRPWKLPARQNILNCYKDTHEEVPLELSQAKVVTSAEAGKKHHHD